MTDDRGPTYGLFLNLGANLGAGAEEVFELTLEQARLAERLGYRDVWVTEHHLIPFGINPSALTTAAFLLGRTERIRVGTAVVLAPLQRPVAVAEQAALLDQLSGGRFDLGIGRGGYLKDYEVLGVDVERWDAEPLATAEAALRAWSGVDLARPEDTTGPSPLHPPVRTRPHPPLFLASSSPDAVAFAAEHRLPLQHYFASPIEARLQVEQRYAEASPDPDRAAEVGHLHTLIVVVTDDESTTREALAGSLARSFGDGDWPKVPNQPQRHAGPDGKPISPAAMAQFVAEGAIVGEAAKVRDQLEAFVARTGARRLALYVEAIADPATTRRTIEALAIELGLGKPAR